MISHACEQGDFNWRLIRHAMPTCSQYSRILTPARLEYAKGSATYRAELLAAWALGHPLDSGDTAWTERGREMEAEARGWYEFQHDAEVRQVGFLMRDDGCTGGSPDGLVAEDGGIEVKCLSAHKHVEALLAPSNDEWRGQIQGLLYITGRAWWDLVLYNPVLPRRVVRFLPEEKYLAALEPALARFLDEVEDGKRALLAMGLRLPGHVRPPAQVAA